MMQYNVVLRHALMLTSMLPINQEQQFHERGLAKRKTIGIETNLKLAILQINRIYLTPFCSVTGI